MKLIIIKIPEVLHSRAINGELTDLDTMFICGAVAQSTPLEEELENIKAKINSEDIDCQYEEDYEYSGGLQKAIEIIDNRIAELKGENKE